MPHIDAQFDFYRPDRPSNLDQEVHLRTGLGSTEKKKRGPVKEVDAAFIISSITSPSKELPLFAHVSKEDSSVKSASRCRIPESLIYTFGLLTNRFRMFT
jgi:hypothetical protein